MSLKKAALRYTELGFSTVATGENKRSVVQWKQYQRALPTAEQTAAVFSHEKATGVAVICGAVSGNLEVIDVDCKYDLTGSLFEDLVQAIADADTELMKRLVIATTAGGGYHLWYRMDAACSDGNQKLAQRPATDEEKKKDPHDKVRVLLETRGEGGYVIASPTPGYKFIQGSPADVPVVTKDQRRMLLEIARSFHQIVDEVQPTGGEQQALSKAFFKSPFTDYNERGDVVALLQKHGWKLVKNGPDKAVMLRPGETTSKSSGDYSRKLGLFMVFSTSTEFEAQRGYRPSTVYAMLEHGGDFKAAAKALLASGYGEPFRKVPKNFRDKAADLRGRGIVGEQMAKELVDEFKITMDEAEKVVHTLDAEDDDDTFWVYDAEKSKLHLKLTRFARFLESNGFALYFYDPASPIFRLVHNDNGRLTEATPERIKKYTEHFINSYPMDGLEYSREELLELVYRTDRLFKDTLIEYLHPSTFDFLRDTADTAYIPFRNGIVEIKADSVNLVPYGDDRRVIWKNDLIDFSVDLDLQQDDNCEYADFLARVTGVNDDRLLSAMSLTGYLLHRYKHPARPYAVILGEEVEDDTKGGGTGKGIFIKALEHMVPTVSVDGKQFKPDKSFLYQRVSLSTKIIALQDVNKFFPFESLNSTITEGLTLEKKNKDELYMRYEDAPKFVISTNYTIADEAAHSKRRQKLIEFAPYFSATHTPFDEYGHMMFNSWDSDEWNRFYNFMFLCIQLYLKRGVIDVQQGDSYRLKKLKVQFGEDFVSHFEDYSQNGCGQWHRFKDEYNSFLTKFDLDKRDYSAKKFSKALQVTAENLGWVLEKQKNMQDNAMIHIKMTKK